MIKLTALIALATTASAATVAIDQPDRWYDPVASHHYGHFTRGALTGTAAWTVVYTWTGSKGRAWAAGTATSLAVTVAYEVAMSRIDSTSIIDPVDMGWEMAGSLISQGVSHAIGREVHVAASPDRVSIGLAWNF